MKKKSVKKCPVVGYCKIKIKIIYFEKCDKENKKKNYVWIHAQNIFNLFKDFKQIYEDSLKTI